MIELFASTKDVSALVALVIKEPLLNKAVQLLGSLETKNIFYEHTKERLKTHKIFTLP